jgi:UDP-N-acetylmuramate--alanine ligase
MKKINKHIHLMGVGGSGMSAVAAIAKHQGYKISGCDLQKDTPYMKNIRDLDIPVFIGHSFKHINNADILAVTPAVLYQNKDHPEIAAARKNKEIVTWQKVLGKYLHRGKEVICITGTHGKSTTTAMAALLFETAKKDPSVVIGAKVTEWGANYRLGEGKIFITEADEFFDNFLNYNPQVVILNNIELDHPDFFKSEEHVLRSFTKFIKKLKGKKILIVNQDSEGNRKLFDILGREFLSTIKVYGYTFQVNPLLDVSKSMRARILKIAKNYTTFSVDSSFLKLHNHFRLKIPGEHNVANALGVIILAKLYKIETGVIEKSLSSYSGIGRRLELIGTKRGIKVYDDYAHHPTAVFVTIEALRQQFPKQRIWVIMEPHSYSRTKALLGRYKRAFDHADVVVIGPIFKARDSKTFGVSGQSIVDVAEHGDARYIGDLNEIIKLVKKSVKKEDVIVAMGAGESYKWARKIFSSI